MMNAKTTNVSRVVQIPMIHAAVDVPDGVIPSSMYFLRIRPAQIQAAGPVNMLSPIQIPAIATINQIVDWLLRSLTACAFGSTPPYIPGCGCGA